MKYVIHLLAHRIPPSHPARGAWIEIVIAAPPRQSPVSHPARGAWIEIRLIPWNPVDAIVAPRTGCVD